MAEALLRSKAGDRFDVRSAGVFASDGGTAASETIEALSEKGIDFDHKSKRLDEALVRWADVILTMSEDHKRTVQEQFSDSTDKVYTLKEYAGDDVQQRENWSRLQASYAEMETKRAFYRTGLEGGRLAKKEARKVEREIIALEKEIQTLEGNLPSFDISDPFGGTAGQYRQIRDELGMWLDRFIEKESAGD